MRYKRKRRVNHSESFYRNIYDKIVNKEDQVENDVIEMDKEQKNNAPCYRTTFKLLKNPIA